LSCENVKCISLLQRINSDLYKNNFITIVHHRERKNKLQTFPTGLFLPRSANEGSHNQDLLVKEDKKEGEHLQIM